MPWRMPMHPSCHPSSAIDITRVMHKMKSILNLATTLIIWVVLGALLFNNDVNAVQIVNNRTEDQILSLRDQSRPPISERPSSNIEPSERDQYNHRTEEQIVSSPLSERQLRRDDLPMGVITRYPTKIPTKSPTDRFDMLFNLRVASRRPTKRPTPLPSAMPALPTATLYQVS